VNTYWERRSPIERGRVTPEQRNRPARRRFRAFIREREAKKNRGDASKKDRLCNLGTCGGGAHLYGTRRKALTALWGKGKEAQCRSGDLLGDRCRQRRGKGGSSKSAPQRPQTKEGCLQRVVGGHGTVCSKKINIVTRRSKREERVSEGE